MEMKHKLPSLPVAEGLISGVISTADVKQWKQNIRNNDP